MHDFGVVSEQRAVILFNEYLQVNEELPNEIHLYVVLVCVYLSSKISSAKTIPLNQFLTFTLSNSHRFRLICEVNSVDIETNPLEWFLALEIDILNSLKFNISPIVPAEVCAALV